MTVIFTSISFEQGYPELGDEPYDILAAIKSSGAFIRDSWGADIYDGVRRVNNDHVLPKSTMCAFKETQLKSILDEHGITRLIFGGLVTDLCLETSIRSAYDQGFETIALVDGMASLSQEVHERTVEDNLPMFSKLMTHDAVITVLEQG